MQGAIQLKQGCCLFFLAWHMQPKVAAKKLAQQHVLATLLLPKVASLAGIGLQPKVQHDVQAVIPTTCRTLRLRSSSPPARVMRCMLASDQLCTCPKCRRMLALCLSCNSVLYLGGGQAQHGNPACCTHALLPCSCTHCQPSTQCFARYR